MQINHDHEWQYHDLLVEADNQGYLRKVTIPGTEATTDYGWQLTQDFRGYSRFTTFDGRYYDRPRPVKTE